MDLTITTKGGILADVMGLGKTITTLSLIKANTIKNDKKELKLLLIVVY